MGLLMSLGVNQTLFFQFGIFVAVFVVLKYVLFVPYFAAFNKRNEATVGQTELAERYLSETKALEEAFAQKAQAANEKYRAVYDQIRADTVKEYDRLVSDARARAKTRTDAARKKIEADMQTARTQLTKEIPGVSQLIVQKLIGGSKP